MAELKIIIDSTNNALNRYVLDTVRKSKGWAKLERTFWLKATHP